MAMATTAQQPQPLPLDEAVRYGQLPNGLTYYIRHNEYPKQRCEFHIAQAVGATLENDDQNGLAHFLEHMCFNGTEHFPGKKIIEYFESIGVDFGGNINAYTSLDRTVYRLSEVPTIREGILDSALLVLHDWSCAVSLLDDEIDAERGVIREEWRTGNTANRRAWTASMKIMFPGSKYATRDVIGDTAVINNFSHDALRAYYHKWYGPDLQAIVVVGDIDVDKMEQKIKELWNAVPERSNRGERPYEQIAENKDPIVGIYTDAEAQRTLIEMIYKHAPVPAELQGTDMAESVDVCHELIASILNERLQAYLMDPASPLGGAQMGYDHVFPTLDGFEVYGIAKEGQEKAAIEVLLREVEKMRRYGFTDDEVERAKTNMINELEKRFNERNTTPNIDFVHEYVGHFLDHDAIPGIEYELQFVKAFLSMVQPAMLNQLAAAYVTPENLVMSVTAPKKEAVVLPSEEDIRGMITAMPNLSIEAPKASVVDANLVKKLPKAAKIKSIVTDTILGTTEWRLSNGVRIVLKPTPYQQDQILLRGVSEGGKSLLSPEDLPSAELVTDAVYFMGLGDYSMSDLQKALSGKTVGTNFEIGAYTESVEGESSVKDLESMLQLIYLGFTAPRRDEASFASLMNLLSSQLANKDMNPKQVFRDSVKMTVSGHSPRTMLLDTALLHQVSLDRCMRIYKARFANPADFTFVMVGNIDPADKNLQKLVCTYLGGIKSKTKAEHFRDNGVRVPAGHVLNAFSRQMTTHTASNYIQYTAYNIPYTLPNELGIELIGNILSRRYLESIREREGGSYGVGTYGYMTQYPVASTRLVMRFDTDPLKQEKLMAIIHEEVQTILQNGPLADDLGKDKEVLVKAHAEDVEKNGWWADSLLDYLMTGINTMVGYNDAVNAITGADIRALLQQLCDNGNVLEVVMSPAE